MSFSALQRAENSSIAFGANGRGRTSNGFSALQRAENSSIIAVPLSHMPFLRFQCSSASRKFLNSAPLPASARWRSVVSVLFSEPKIPQCLPVGVCIDAMTVSVLFSEPKIPQPEEFAAYLGIEPGFSALQRAENSSTERKSRSPSSPLGVSVLFSEPKIPQYADRRRMPDDAAVSVLFSEPKIPQCAD